MVAALLLAGGESTRMGRPKALLEWGGETLIEYQIDELRQPPVELVVVVLGHRANDVRPFAEKLECEVISQRALGARPRFIAPDWAPARSRMTHGQSSSWTSTRPVRASSFTG